MNFEGVPDDSRASRESRLERENASLRAALVRAGVDVGQALAHPPGTQESDVSPPGDVRDAHLTGDARLADELRSSQAALSESRRRLHNLLAMETLGILVWAADFTLKEVNDAFLAMSGFTREEVLGLSWQQLTPAEFVPASLHAIDELKTRGESTPYEKQYLRKDGSRWWGLFAARTADDEAIEVVLDVSARRHTQQALRDREQQLRLIVESARDYAIMTTDPDGRITQWFPGAEAVFGWPADEVVGHTAALIFTPEDRAGGRPAKEMAIAVEQGVAPDVRWHMRRDGSRVFIEGHLTALRGPQQELRGFLKIGQDVTERWNAEEQLRRSEAALRHLNETLEAKVDSRTAELRHAVEALHAEAMERAHAEEALRQAQKMEAVGQLTGGLAHDFNNLLTGIVGSLELLHTRVVQGRFSDLDRYIAAARGAADRAAVLTHRLLAFSRRQALDPRPTDLNALVRDMLDLLRRTIGPHIVLEVRDEESLWMTLCDPNQTENALLNLCINARDAMPDGGRLVIETANARLDRAEASALHMAPGAYVVLRVIDTGTGMPPEVLARALDPFYTTKPLGQGTGLGLSMIYGFARQSGGQVHIDSEPGRGTSVAIYLPRHHGRAQVEAADPETIDTPHAEANEAVLVVDDEPTVRMLVGEVLRELGYTALEAADGASGLRILKSQPSVDLLVTDVGLPGGMSGRQLADAARLTHPQLKVLFITGYAAQTVLGEGAPPPGMQVMTKPFAMETLALRIRDMLQAAAPAQD